MAGSIFEGFDPNEIKAIKAAGTAVNIPANWSLIWERTPPDKAYVILEGDVSVRRGGEEIARLGPGDIMGETAIVNHSLRTASVVSLTPLKVLHYTKDAVEGLVAKSPKFRRALEVAAEGRPGATTNLVDSTNEG